VEGNKDALRLRGAEEERFELGLYETPVVAQDGYGGPLLCTVWYALLGF